eukprot:3322582-Rhodomonas_salina.3
MMTNDAGVIAPLRTITPCSMPPDQVRYGPRYVMWGLESRAMSGTKKDSASCYARARRYPILRVRARGVQRTSTAGIASVARRCALPRRFAVLPQRMRLGTYCPSALAYEVWYWAGAGGTEPLYGA